MKNLLMLILAVVFLPTACLAGPAVFMQMVSGEFVHDCSGDQSFGWSAESTTLTTGNPAGCTDGSATLSASGDSISLSDVQRSDGTYAVLSGDGADYYTASSFDGDEFDYTDFKVEVDVYVDTWVTGAVVWNIQYDADNRIKLFLSGSDTAIGFSVLYEGNNTQDSVGASSANFDENEWIHVVVAGKPGQGAGVDDLSVSASDINITTRALTNTVTDTDQDETAAWTNAADECFIGNSGGAAATIRVDRFKIFKTSGL